MNITLYSPHKKQLEVHGSKARFKVVNYGRRGGKSTLAQNYIICPGLPDQMADWPIKGALQEVGRYWIIAPTYTQAKSVYWRGLMFSKDPKDTTAIPKELIAKKNESELIITLINGSTIELKGADNPDSLRGAGIKGVVLDEYAFWANPDAWEFVIQPALSDSGGWAMFISTPNGYNHFYDMATRAQVSKEWSYHRATIEDNPNIAEEEKARLKEELDEDTFAQEYMAEFRKMKGLVYPEFDQKIHVYDPNSPEEVIGKRIPLGGLYGMGVDPGTRNALAGLFVYIDQDNNWYIEDELYVRQTDTETDARLIKQKMGTNYYTWKIADQAAAQFILDMNTIYGIAMVGQKKTKDAMEDGIKMVRSMLKVQEGTGKPKLFVANHCKNFIREIESYHYPEKKNEQNEREDPVKENDHLMDAMRYLKLATYLPASPAGPKYKKIYDPVTGRRIGQEQIR